MGVFIVIDGIDGCGKSTQVKLLFAQLMARGLDVAVTKWQDSSYLKKLYIGDLIKKIQDGSVIIPPESRTFLLGADIAYRLENMITPWLEEGKTVIGDRYIYKIIAQGIARGLDKSWLINLFRFAPSPEIKIMLDIPPEIALQRILKSREVSFYEAGLDVLNESQKEAAFLKFQTRVREEMQRLMQEDRGMVIKADLSAEEQNGMIMEYVEQKLKLKPAHS